MCLNLQSLTRRVVSCVWLQVKNMVVYVEKKVLEDPAISGDENFGAITKKFCTFREGKSAAASLQRERRDSVGLEAQT